MTVTDVGYTGNAPLMRVTGVTLEVSKIGVEIASGTGTGFGAVTGPVFTLGSDGVLSLDYVAFTSKATEAGVFTAAASIGTTVIDGSLGTL